MITTINIRISSGHVNMPLPMSAVIEGSSATVVVDGVPSRKSGIAINGCIVSVTNPAGQTTSMSATAMGGQYVATIPASHFAAAGNVRKGVMIECVGKDEQNADRSWRLGIGDLVVIPSDANPTNLGTLQGVNYRTSVPANPVAGDLAKHGSTWKIFTGSAWESFGGSGSTPDWEDVQNKPTSFPPSAHSSTHAADGSDPITPEGIGALSSTVGGVSGYVMLLGGVQYIMQTAYTQSGVDGWGTADGEWKLFVSASGSVLLLKNGVAKPTNPLSVAGLPLPWNLQLLDGSGTAVVSDAGATSTEEIIGHLRSHDNPHGVTAAQIGAAAAGDIPTALSQLDGDATHRVVTDVEKEAWNAKQNALTFDNAPTSGSANPVKSGGIHTALARKLDATNPVLFGMLNFETTINLLYNASSGNLATQGSGEDTPRNLAHIDELEYDAANDDTRPEGLAQPRSVSTYKVVAGTPLTITLPTVSASDKSVSNLDIIIDAIGVTTLPAITIQPATGGKAYAVKGTMPEIKADCITMIDATSIPGMNAWVVLGASELKEVTNA